MKFIVDEETFKKAKAKANEAGNCYGEHYNLFLDSFFGDTKVSKFVSDLNSLRLCHGTVKDPLGINPRHGHAWIEAENLCIFIKEGKIGALPIAVFYALGNIKDVKRYTRKEAASWGLKTGHLGPWE